MSSLMSVARDARDVRVGVVGDLIVDRYLIGETGRISPEAPIPVLAVTREDVRLGGAGNVVANLRAIGASVWVGGVIGHDENGDAMLADFERVGAQVDGVVRDPGRPTVEKTRLIARSQQILRFDREDASMVTGDVERQVMAAISGIAAESDMVVVSDYAKGVITPGVFTVLKESGTRLMVDPKGRDYSRYRGAYCITPNRSEAEAATQVKIRGEASLREAARRLFEIVDGEVVLITLGEDGMFCASRAGAEFHIHTEARKVFDVTGAGDTVIALLARFLAADVAIPDAVRIANAGAGVVVGQLGAATVGPEDLYSALGGRIDESRLKILERRDAATVASRLRDEGKKVVFTNGCFDLLHAGHVRYLSLARAQGDVLILGLNDDASVRALKGPERPINTWEDRAQVLAALSAVDHVVPFHEETPLELIKEVTPHVLVKGEDWRDKGVVGREWVEAHGGRVHLAPLLDGRSTTRVVEQIRAEGGPGAQSRSP